MIFIRRNKPIFIVGIIVAFIFIVLIVYSTINNEGTNLSEVPSSMFNVKEKEKVDIVAVENPTATKGDTEALEKLPPAVEEEEEEVPQISSGSTDVEITFSEDGFKPSSTQIAQNQVVTWKNTTEREIVIKELISKHKEFAEGLIIPPGGSFTLKIYGSKMWTFKELESGKIGRMLILSGE